MSYSACTRGYVYTFVCSLQACLSLSLRLCFLCMFNVFHFQAVINSLNPYRPPGFALLVFACLCSHFVWNLLYLSHPPPSLHRFPHSLSLPLSRPVKCATSATLFCPSLGTLAQAGQWILMSSFRAHTVKARHKDLWIPLLYRLSHLDTLTGPHPVPPTPPTVTLTASILGQGLR